MLNLNWDQIDWSIVGAVGIWVQGIIVGVSIIFLWRELVNVRQGIRSTSYHSTYNLMVEIDRFFYDHPDKLTFFREGTKIPDDDKIQKEVMIAAEMLTDYFDNVFHQQETSPLGTYEGFKVYMQETYSNSPALKKYLQEHERWYPENFVKMLKTNKRG